jgi:hypothetical protein
MNYDARGPPAAAEVRPCVPLEVMCYRRLFLGGQRGIDDLLQICSIPGRI